MGQSLGLITKEFLTLSLEIDRDISIELSTGFGGPNRCTTITSMPLTLEELDSIISDLSQIRDVLKESWKCPLCNSINRKEWEVCNTCDD